MLLVAIVLIVPAIAAAFVAHVGPSTVANYARAATRTTGRTAAAPCFGDEPEDCPRPMDYVPDGFDYTGVRWHTESQDFAQFPQPQNFRETPLPSLPTNDPLGVNSPISGKSVTSPYVPPFTHFVVIMRENHAFDDYLGDCKSFNSTCDGVNQSTNHVAQVPNLHNLAKKYALLDEYSTGVPPPSGPNHWYLFAAAVTTQAQQGSYTPHGTMFDRYLNSSTKVTFVTAGDIYWEVASGSGWYYNKSKIGGAGPDALPVWRNNTGIREELDYNNYSKSKINDDDTLIRNDYEHFVNHSGLPTYSFIELFNDHPGTYQDIPKNDAVSNDIVNFLLGNATYADNTVVVVTEDDTQNCANGNDHVSCTYRVPTVIAASPKYAKQHAISHVAYNTTNVIALAERVANNVDPGIISADGSLGKSTFPLNQNDSRALGDPLEDLWIKGSGPRLSVSASGSPALGNVPLSVGFHANATGGTSPYSWAWTFGDGGTAATQNPTHTYSTHGSYNATVTVTDAKNAQASATVAIKADDTTDAIEDRANADSTSGQVPLVVHFTGLAGGGQPPYTWNWSFGDKTYASTQSAAHTYNTPATYTANLTVTDTRGASARSSVTITASPSGGTSPQPTATASPMSGTAPLAVQFNGSAVGGIPPYTWLWDFKDGSTSTQQNPQHTFQSAGTYIVKLTATDSGSANGTTNVTVTVNPAGGGGTPKTFFTDDMESGKNGWTVVRNSGTGTSTWKQVTSQSNSPTHSWTCGGGTSYAAGSDCDLISPKIDLTNASNAKFTWFNKIGGDSGDTGSVWVSKDDNVTYTQIVGGLQGITIWTNETYDLANYTGVLGSSQVRLKFHFVSDASGNGNAWFVDDVKVWGATGPTTTVPGAPTGLTATAGNAQVSLSWTAPSSGGSAITNYKIYRATTSGSETLYSQTGGANTSYVDKKVTNGVTYYYKVSAVNSVGEGAQSAEASATPTSGATVPAAPTGLTATAGNAQVSLSWSAPSSGGSAITNYKIYRGTTSGGETLYSQTGGANTSYVDKKATNGQTYYYEVSAVNSVGEGAKSNEASATPATVPGAPSALTATAGNAQVSLSWTAPSTGGSAITNYKIYRATTSGSETLYSQTGGANTSYVDKKVTNGVTYYYKVSAVNSVGEGAQSNEASATPSSSTTFFSDDFESGSSKWTFRQLGGSGTSNWHDYDFSGTPSSYHSATHALECGGGTSYTANTHCAADTVKLDLTSAKSATLKFWQKVEGEEYFGSFWYDYGTVKVSKNGGSTWCTLETDLAGITGWRQDSLDLSKCSGVLGSSQVVVRFDFVSDSTIENGGWFIDDVNITGST